MRNCASSIEEFTHNQTSRRDDIIRGFVKHQSRYVKRAEDHAAFNLYARYFDTQRCPALMSLREAWELRNAAG